MRNEHCITKKLSLYLLNGKKLHSSGCTSRSQGEFLEDLAASHSVRVVKLPPLDEKLLKALGVQVANVGRRGGRYTNATARFTEAIEAGNVGFDKIISTYCLSKNDSRNLGKYYAVEVSQKLLSDVNAATSGMYITTNSYIDALLSDNKTSYILQGDAVDQIIHLSEVHLEYRKSLPGLIENGEVSLLQFCAISNIESILANLNAKVASETVEISIKAIGRHVSI